MDAIDTLSDDELDYEYQDEEVNARYGTKDEKNQNESSEVIIAPSITVDTSRRGVEEGRKNRTGGYVDLDGLSYVDRNLDEVERKSIHERVKITALRRNTDNERDSRDDKVDPYAVKELFDSLDVDPNDTGLRKASVFVKGVDKMSEFGVKRIFAEHSPNSVQFVDDSSCTVRWLDEVDVIKMFLAMTKPMRRVRGPRKPEEGELLESGEDEEEVGQVKEENGEDVAVVSDVSNLTNKKKRKQSDDQNDDFVEINIEEVKLPSGKWRVVTRHVPDNRLIIARFATGFDIRRGVINARNRTVCSDEEPHTTSDRDGYNYEWKAEHVRVRPGLNVFDEKGNELEWDYEHDTRFFASDSSDSGECDDNDNCHDRKKKSRLSTDKLICPPQPSHLVVGDVQIRSRGRGAKKCLAALASNSHNTDSRTDQAEPQQKSTSPTLASDMVEASRPLNSQRKTKSPKKWMQDRHKSNSDSDNLEDYEDLNLDESTFDTAQ